jgi:hypothetical protein
MKLHRILAVATTLSLGATLFTATSAFADPIEAEGGFLFTTSGSTASIVGYTGTDLALSIPSIVDDGFSNFTVTSIGDDAFNTRGLVSVTIPIGITSIGSFAFAANELTSFVIPTSVTSIGTGAFSSNELASISLPDSLTVINDSTFSNNSLTSVTIPNAVTSIGANAFAYSPALASVTIGRSVASIGAFAFGGSSSLASALFLGDAPTTMVQAGNGGPFDSADSTFTVSFLYGNTTFGNGNTWWGYNITQPSPPTSTSDVTAGVTSGVRSAALGLAAFGLVPFSHGEQLVDTTATLAVDDLTGAGIGWNVTLSSSALTWTAANGGPTTGTDLPASALAVTTVGEITTVAGENWVGDTAIGALGSPVKVLSTSGGNGSYTTPLTLTLTVPGQASVGTYAGTLTTTISAAP